jgi:hypothetical protein
MSPRPLAALTAALAIAGASLTAATAAPSHGTAGPSKAAPSAHIQLNGAASNWSAARGTVALTGVRVSGGPKAVRRAVRRGATVTLRLGAATRVVVVDGDGDRSRVTAAALFDELDLAEGEVAVEAGGRVPKAARASGRRVVIPATRVVAHLPPAAEDDPDADLGEEDPGWEDGGEPGDPGEPDDPGADPGDPGAGDPAEG